MVSAYAPRRVSHPAKFSDSILSVIAEYIPQEGLILDPFAGVGRLREVHNTHATIVLNEIEPEWAIAGKADTIGDALSLPYSDQNFDGIVTSPCYGNRMADHHNARDHSPRITYRHVLGRPLSPANSGQLQWGERYREFHRRAWIECDRVLKPGGTFILNVSAHIRDGKYQDVPGWHLAYLKSLGYLQIHTWWVKTPRMRRGENSKLRVEFENVFVLVKTGS